MRCLPLLLLAPALLVPATGCASGEREPPRPRPEAAPRAAVEPPPARTEPPVPVADGARTAPAGGAAPPAVPEREGFAAATSNDGTYRVLYRPLGGAIKRGATFAVEVWVLDPASGRAPEGVSLAADAAMPEHEHGMNREPRVVPDGAAPGRFEVEGLLFHMAGRWELYLDVTRGALTERAQFEVTLE